MYILVYSIEQYWLAITLTLTNSETTQSHKLQRYLARGFT